MLKAEGKDSELNEFMIECKQYKKEDDIYKYSVYVHGWLIPYLDKMRREGRLTKGKYFSKLKRLQSRRNGGAGLVSLGSMRGKLMKWAENAVKGLLDRLYGATRRQELSSMIGSKD